jgi:hypothetical protein
MIVAYLFLLLVLALVHFLVRRRVARLEARFTAVAAEADTLVKQASMRGGNCSRPDPYQAAKHQYALARLAMKRDRLEDRYTSWQSFSERFAKFRSRLVGYRGKALPYVFGVFDVATVMLVFDRFGVGLTQLKAMLGI